MIKRAFLSFGLLAAICFINAIHASNNDVGSPLITNYKTEVYLAHPQNWGIIQDDRGLMYFANGDGVLVYDGSTWELVELPNKIPARTLGKDKDGIIYTAGNNELGYLQPNKFGGLKYISLLDSLGFSNTGTFRDIISTDSCIYFRSELFIIRLNSKGFSYWKAKSTYSIFFLYNNDLFIQDDEYGLFKLENNSLVLAPSGKDFISKKFYFARQLKDEVILANRIKGLYKYSPGSEKAEKLKHIVSDANQELISDFIYSGTITKDEKIVLGTNSGGCIIVDSKGEILSKITRKTGILQNKIHFVYIDKDENLWLALDKGISRCDYSGPISFWNEQNGLEGTIQTIIQYQGTLYLGSLQGLYFLKNSIIHKVQSDISQTWSFFKFIVPNTNREILLIGTFEGVYFLENNKLFKIPNTNNIVIYNLFQSQINPSIIYVGTEVNMGVLEYTDGHFDFKGLILNTGQSIRSIVEENNGELWLGTFRLGVIRITPSDNILTPKKIIHYTLESGLPTLKNILLYHFNNNLVFATEQGFYLFDKERNKFIPDNTLGNIFSSKSKDIFSFTADSHRGAYITQLMNYHGSIGYASKASYGSYQWNSHSYNKLPIMMMLVTYLDQNENLWIGGSEGLYKFDQSAKEKKDTVFNTFIKKVSINRDSSIFYGSYYIEKDGKRIITTTQNELFKYEIEHRNNSIAFNYSAPDFSNEFELKYKFKLDGFDDKWSEWSNSTYKEYTNLHEGDYKFRVISKNIYDTIGKEGSFEFTILPPWYRTKTAFVSCLLFFILLIFFIVRLSIRSLKDTNTHLENQVLIRTYEINQQKEELLTQSEELMVVTEELERKNVELEKLSIVASKTDNAIVIMDGQGNFEWVNEGFTYMYGLTFDEFLAKRGRNIFECTSTPEILRELTKCITEKETVTYEFHYKDGLNKNVWAQTTITPILDEKNNIVKLIAIDSDITSLKIAEQEIFQHKTEIEAQRDYTKQQNEFIEQQNIELEKHRTNLEQLVLERTSELEIAKEHAEESDRLKSAFLANMSHEIRTPMNAIVGFSNLLKQSEIAKEEKEEFIQQITLNSNTLLNLIDDILNISKIEAGLLTITKKSFNINKLLSNLFEVFSEQKNNLYNKPIDLKLVLGVNDPNFEIYSDSLRIQQVITNLVDNALKFTDKGCIEYGYFLINEANASILKFYVKDTGIGLEDKQRDQIFNRFIKIENYQKLYRGAGLGLAICKNLVSLLDGEIYVESEFNVGSVFYFTIPIIINLEDKKEINSNSELKNEFYYSWPGKTVLIAEDENSNFRLLQVILKNSNLTIIRAFDGNDAVVKFENNTIDLILMDIKMPVMDGLEATRLIRQTNLTVPIIAQTAYAMQDDEKLGLEAGCTEYISKPIRPDNLLHLLNKYLFDK